MINTHYVQRTIEALRKYGQSDVRADHVLRLLTGNTDSDLEPCGFTERSEEPCGKTRDPLIHTGLHGVRGLSDSPPLHVFVGTATDDTADLQTSEEVQA